MAGLEYDNNEWKPNWIWENNSKFLKWLSTTSIKFPTPTYSIGQNVSIKFSDIWQTGKVTNIVLAFNHTNNFLELTENDIRYDVYCNGHTRWIFDNSMIRPLQ